jgi:hypothetical protein
MYLCKFKFPKDKKFVFLRTYDYRYYDYFNRVNSPNFFIWETKRVTIGLTPSLYKGKIQWLSVEPYL